MIVVVVTGAAACGAKTEGDGSGAGSTSGSSKGGSGFNVELPTELKGGGATNRIFESYQDAGMIEMRGPGYLVSNGNSAVKRATNTGLAQTLAFYRRHCGANGSGGV